MFTAIISTIISSISGVFWKKSLNFEVGLKIHELIGYLPGLLLVFYIIFYYQENYLDIPLYIIGIIFAFVITSIYISKISQEIYMENKASYIIPYENINKIIIIVFSFIFFQDVSNISFILCLIAVIVIILFSLDLKDFKIPKGLGKIILLQFIRATETITIGLILKNYSEKSYFMYYIIMGIIVLGFIVLFSRQFKTIKNKQKDFWIARLIGSMWPISWFLSLVLIKNVGLTTTTLLSFLGIFSTLTIAYIVLKEIPTKKEIILTVIVSILVGLGFYFK